MLQAALIGLSTVVAFVMLAIGSALGRRAERSRRGGTVDLVGARPTRKKNADDRFASDADDRRLLETHPWAGADAKCAECWQPKGQPHLGTCSGALVHGGSGIVGFELVEPIATEPLLGRGR